MVWSPAKEARSWRIEGQKKNHEKRVSEAFSTSLKWKVSWPKKKGLWNLVRERILRERGALLEEKGGAFREYKAMHEEKFLSSWLRRDGREEERGTGGDGHESEEERAKRGEEKGRNKRTKPGMLKEDVTVLLLWRPSDFFVKWEIWRVAVIFLGKPFLDKPEDLSRW